MNLKFAKGLEMSNPAHDLFRQLAGKFAQLAERVRMDSHMEVERGEFLLVRDLLRDAERELADRVDE